MLLPGYDKTAWKRWIYNLLYKETIPSSLGGCAVYQSTLGENEYNNSMMLFSIFSSLLTSTLGDLGACESHELRYVEQQLTLFSIFSQDKLFL